VSEQDLALKAEVRRLFWRLGFSTKVDVPLRAYVPAGTGRKGEDRQAYTDLDVLGVMVGPDLRVQSVIGDCKTSPRGSTERMFWIRGVADFFGADDAYMVRSADATAAARQLAARLGVAVLTPRDLKALEAQDGGTKDMETLAFLFDHRAIATYRQALQQSDRRLKGLLEYREFDYWVYEEHRNLLQVVAHLAEAAGHLDPNHPIHVAMFFEYAWLYVRSLALAAQHIRRTHLTDLDTSLREYLFGGQLGLREKQHLAQVLARFAGRKGNPENDVFPPYFPQLLELVTRLGRRSGHLTALLRYAEVAAEGQVARRARPLPDLFPGSLDDIAAKLLLDVCSFLVAATQLDPGFEQRSRSILLPEVPDAGSGLGATPTDPQQAKLVDG
jgi:hypothetical protein